MADGMKRAHGAALLSQGKGHFVHKERGGDVRVMGVVEGWVVARFKEAMPFLKREREFLDEFEIWTGGKKTNDLSGRAEGGKRMTTNELNHSRSLLRTIADLPDNELWKAQGLEHELEPFWLAVWDSWREHLPELLEPRSEPDLSAFEGVKPYRWQDAKNILQFPPDLSPEDFIRKLRDDEPTEAEMHAFLDDLISENAEALEGLRKLGD